MLFRAKTKTQIELGAKADKAKTQRPPLEIQAGELVDLPLSTAQPLLAKGELVPAQLTDEDRAAAAATTPRRSRSKGE